MADLDTYINDNLLYPLQKTEEWRTMRSALESGGLGVRRQKWQSPIYRFTVRVRFFNKTDADSFTDFYNGKKGARTSFTWNPPDELDDEGTYTCIFADDSLVMNLENVNTYGFQFELRATGP